jgi:hypothetical protein
VKKFLIFYNEIPESLAFNDLNKPATTVLLYVLRQQIQGKITIKKSKAKRYIVTNKHEMVIPYKKLRGHPYFLKNQTITRAIDDILANGFLTINEQGGREKGHYTKYSLSEKWRDWRKGQEPFSVRVPFRRRGFTKPDKQAVDVNKIVESIDDIETV